MRRSSFLALDTEEERKEKEGKETTREYEIYNDDVDHSSPFYILKKKRLQYA
jgi:hypothetical protein